MLYKTTVLFFIVFTLTSFKLSNKSNSEYDTLLRLEQKILVKSRVGQEYIYNLTGIDGCNKTRIKYLGTFTTSKGKQYKVLTSFFVFRTGKDMCHGSSAIKIYNIKNKIVGQYSVGMPDDLPDELKNGKLIYLVNSEDCNLRKERSIDLSKGLPKSFFIKCSDSGGDIYTFGGGD